MSLEDEKAALAGLATELLPALEHKLRGSWMKTPRETQFIATVAAGVLLFLREEILKLPEPYRGEVLSIKAPLDRVMALLSLSTRVVLSTLSDEEYLEIKDHLIASVEVLYRLWHQTPIT